MVQTGIDTTIESDEEGSEIEEDDLQEEQELVMWKEELVVIEYPRVVSEVLEDGQRLYCKRWKRWTWECSF